MEGNNSECESFNDMFSKINHYFRDEIVLNGTEHSSTEMGVVIAAAYSLVIVFGAAGNFLTILVVILNPQMRTTRNFFILNLALSDFFVCTVTAPMTLYTVLYMFWPFGTALCKIAGSLQGFNIFLSTFSIAAIALDRYVIVIFPTKRERQQKLSILFFCSIWIIALLLAIPLLLASDLNTIYEDEKCQIKLQICHEQNDIWSSIFISKHAYTLAVVVTQYAFPLCSIVFAYTRIVNRMKARFATRNAATYPTIPQNNSRRRSVIERQRRTHLLLVAVVVLFALAWLPLNVFHIVNTFELVVQFDVATFAVCHVAAMCSACLNPLIYAFFNHNFRAEFVLLFEKAGMRRLRRACGCMPPTTPKAKEILSLSKRLNGRALSEASVAADESQALHLDTDEQL